MNKLCLPILWIASTVLGNQLVAEDAKKLQEALSKLELPGLTLNMKERCVDVDAEVCLHDGLLELIACTEDSKEHESIFVLRAKAMHIHTALLLFNAKPGTPAGQRRFGEGGGQWIPVPPAGDAIRLSLVFPGEDGKPAEHPISEFVEKADQFDFDGTPIPNQNKEKFPPHFLFAGSHLVEDGPGPRKYVADYSGNVISISTFGDELLCLPGIFGHQNGGLSWQVNAEGLPAIGEKITLRLRPVPKQSPKQP